jgi:hypothetical protein
MIRAFAIAAASAAILVLSPTAFAQQTGGTAAEAKAMLMKAVAAVKADKAKALDMFNKGEGGFLGQGPLSVLLQCRRRDDSYHCCKKINCPGCEGP